MRKRQDIRDFQPLPSLIFKNFSKSRISNHLRLNTTVKNGIPILNQKCMKYSAHTSKETQRFLNTMPEGRFKFVFTPKHGAWLNMIESFFSKMTKQMLRGIRVNIKQELEERIYQYFEEVNREPVVYHWKYKMDEISEAEVSSI